MCKNKLSIATTFHVFETSYSHAGNIWNLSSFTLKEKDTCKFKTVLGFANTTKHFFESNENPKTSEELPSRFYFSSTHKNSTTAVIDPANIDEKCRCQTLKTRETILDKFINITCKIPTYIAAHFILSKNILNELNWEFDKQENTCEAMYREWASTIDSIIDNKTRLVFGFSRIPDAIKINRLFKKKLTPCNTIIIKDEPILEVGYH